MSVFVSPIYCPAWLQLAPSLWPAFLDHVLYYIYHDSLPQGLSASQVLQAMRLADRLQVGGAQPLSGWLLPAESWHEHTGNHVMYWRHVAGWVLNLQPLHTCCH